MITRLVKFSVPLEKAPEVERIWKRECIPLMVQQPGCLSHQFLRNHEKPGEFVSFSSWLSQDAINRYLASDVREEIRNQTLGLIGDSRAETILYDVVG